MSLNHKEWYAYENRQPPVDPKSVPFYVVGKIETNNGSIQPELKPSVPQGINAAILFLDLNLVDTGGVGTDDVAYRDARYDQSIVLGQYTSVVIFHNGTEIISMDVQVVV